MFLDKSKQNESHIQFCIYHFSFFSREKKIVQKYGEGQCIFQCIEKKQNNSSKIKKTWRQFGWNFHFFHSLYFCVFRWLRWKHIQYIFRQEFTEKKYSALYRRQLKRITFFHWKKITRIFDSRGTEYGRERPIFSHFQYQFYSFIIYSYVCACKCFLVNYVIFLYEN